MSVGTAPSAVWAVVPAAGSGTRMGAGLPKQYLEIAGRTLLEYALLGLCAATRLRAVVVTLDVGDTRGTALLERLTASVRVPLLAVPGGVRRQDSVASGLAHLPQDASDQDWVLVHDAARPCLHGRDLERLLTHGCVDSGALLATPLAETLKRAGGAAGEPTVATTVDRSALWRAQTPQLFRIGLLRDALARAATDGVDVTDEAQAVERLGLKPRLVEGRPDNLKVTVPGDLALAAALLHPDSEWSRSQGPDRNLAANDR